MKTIRIMAAVLFALLAGSPAFAASRVWISEFGVLTATGSGGVPAQVAPLPSVTNQATLDISVSAQTSAAFKSGTYYIRVLCEVQCAVRGDGSTATTSDTLIPALLPEFFGVQTGKTISVIASP